jgi:peptidoglycan/LPS O-acetylase OafA/YrhL
MNFKFKENNLDLLRLILASSVIFLHLRHLTDVPILNDFFANLDFLSKNAVPAFFIVSGFLIFMSFDKSKSLSSYFLNRALRIYPAYVVLLVLCMMLSLLFVEFIDTLFFKNIASYFFSNILFLNFLTPTLPGLFENNPITVVNGALWTLKVEVMFYLSVPFIYYLVKRYNAIAVLVLLYVASFIYYISLTDYGVLPKYSEFLAHQLPAQMGYFSSGILFYLYFERLMKNRYYLMIFSSLTFILEIKFFMPFALAFLVFYLFVYLPKYSDLSRIGDLSYGVYIYHFPLIQLLVQLGYFESHPFIASAFVFLITYTLAFLSWHIVEKNSLKLKNKFKRNEA